MRRQDSKGAGRRFTFRRPAVDPREQWERARIVALAEPQPWPFSEPFHVTWERALQDHLALGHRLPYALLVGFWDARTLRRVER